MCHFSFTLHFFHYSLYYILGNSDLVQRRLRGKCHYFFAVLPITSYNPCDFFCRIRYAFDVNLHHPARSDIMNQINLTIKTIPRKRT
jgi:hypothetical protein